MKKQIEISKKSGETLKAVHYYQNDSEDVKDKEKKEEIRHEIPFVILCHGFTGDKYEWGRFPATCESLLSEGFESIIFDFSGSGNNIRENITLSKQVDDLKTIYQWAIERGYQRIATLGLSFGGLTSLIPTLEKRKCAIFWAPAFYMTNIIGKSKMFLSKILFTFRNKPLKLESNNNEPILIGKEYFKEFMDLNVNEKLKNFIKPALVVQGTEDDVVNPKDTYYAFSLMPDNEEHKLIKVEGTGHEFEGKYLDKFIEYTINWLKKYL